MFRSVHIVKSADAECTGVFRIVMNLATHARKHGYELTVLFLADGPLRAKASAAGIMAHAIPWKGTFQDVFGAIRVSVWLRRQRAGIAHVHWGGRGVRTICRFGGAKAVVQHVHSRIDEITGGVSESLSFPGADAVIACSKAVAASITSHRAEVIYAGIEVSPTPQSLSLHSGPLRVGVLSRLTLVKNVEALIEAAARLKNLGIEIQANIAGSGPSEPKLRNLATELKVSDRIRFLGWQEEVQNLLSSWDLLVMPSLDEGFPLSAVEAMAAARPVIASRVGGLPEIVVDGVTGYLIAARDIEALVRHIVEWARDRARLAEMGQAGWERARSEFSIEAMSLQVARLYQRLCKLRLENSALRPIL